MRIGPRRRSPLGMAGQLLAAALCTALSTPAGAQQAAELADLTAAGASGAPNYAQAIEGELVALQLSPRCTGSDGVFECIYRGRSSITERGFDVRATYRQDTHSVEVQIHHFLDAPISQPGTDALLRRLMAINWSLLAARFSWNADTGEVRLGATLHTDSNLDRRAFRSLVRALDELGPRYHPELVNLQRSLRAPADKPR